MHKNPWVLTERSKKSLKEKIIKRENVLQMEDLFCLAQS
jgi:hypothetical protein